MGCGTEAATGATRLKVTKIATETGNRYLITLVKLPFKFVAVICIESLGLDVSHTQALTTSLPKPPDGSSCSFGYTESPILAPSAPTMFLKLNPVISSS